MEPCQPAARLSKVNCAAVRERERAHLGTAAVAQTGPDASRRVGMSRIGNPPTCRIPFGEIPMHRDASGPVCATSQPRSESVAVTRCARNRASCVSWLVWLMIIGWLMITEHAGQFAEPL